MVEILVLVIDDFASNIEKAIASVLKKDKSDRTISEEERERHDEDKMKKRKRDRKDKDRRKVLLFSDLKINLKTS